MLQDPRWPRFVQSLEIFTDEEQVQLNVYDTDRPVARRFFDWCGENIPGMVVGALDYRGEFRVSSNSFFQVNRFLIDRLVEMALEGSDGDSALDLYAGVGLFTLPLARRFRQVTRWNRAEARRAICASTWIAPAFRKCAATRRPSKCFWKS
jgi:23S rRNA (uracil1939-C5)-methyltransferase